jgi:hypothetical protein
MVRHSLEAPFLSGWRCCLVVRLPIFMQEEVVYIDPRMPRNAEMSSPSVPLSDNATAISSSAGPRLDEPRHRIGELRRCPGLVAVR